MSKSQQSPPTLRKALGVGVFVALIYFIICIVLFLQGGFFYFYREFILLFQISPLILVTTIAGAVIGRWLSKKWYGVWIGAFLMLLLDIFIIYILIWKV